MRSHIIIKNEGLQAEVFNYTLIYMYIYLYFIFIYMEARAQVIKSESRRQDDKTIIFLEAEAGN